MHFTFINILEEAYLKRWLSSVYNLQESVKLQANWRTRDAEDAHTIRRIKIGMKDEEQQQNKKIAAQSVRDWSQRTMNLDCSGGCLPACLLVLLLLLLLPAQSTMLGGGLSTLRCLSKGNGSGSVSVCS